MKRITRLFSVAVLAGTMTLTASGAFCQEKIVRMSLDACIGRALTENLSLQQSQLGLSYNRLSVAAAEAAFDPSLSLSVNRNESVTPNFYQYFGVSSVESKSSTLNLGLRQQLGYGGSWDFGFDNNLSESNVQVEKNYTSNLGFQFSQPLLKGFGKKVTRSNIYQARISSERAKNELESQAVDLVYQVAQAYWNLVYARETMNVRKMSIAQADSLLAYNQKGLDLGVMTESDVLEAKSALIARQQEEIAQRDLIRSYEDTLRRLLNLTADADWVMIIETTDAPTVKTIDLDATAALSRALTDRPDFRTLARDIEQQQLALEVSKNNLLPALDLSTQYRINGSGKTYDKNFRELGDTDEYGWSVGVTLNYPISNRAAKTSYEQQQINSKRTDLSRKNLESQAMTEIRTSIRRVLTSSEQIEAAKIAVELNELKLRKEEERFRNKLSSSYYVLQFQLDLANSRNTYNRAMMDHELALLEYRKARGSLLSDMNISIVGKE